MTILINIINNRYKKQQQRELYYHMKQLLKNGR